MVSIPLIMARCLLQQKRHGRAGVGKKCAQQLPSVGLKSSGAPVRRLILRPAHKTPDGRPAFSGRTDGVSAPAAAGQAAWRRGDGNGAPQTQSGGTHRHARMIDARASAPAPQQGPATGFGHGTTSPPLAPAQRMSGSVPRAAFRLCVVPLHMVPQQQAARASAQI